MMSLSQVSCDKLESTMLLLDVLLSTIGEVSCVRVGPRGSSSSALGSLQSLYNLTSDLVHPLSSLIRYDNDPRTVSTTLVNHYLDLKKNSLPTEHQVPFCRLLHYTVFIIVTLLMCLLIQYLCFLIRCMI